MSNVRTRFAPSPTGFVHIGSLRTALFSYLYARHSKGSHTLRIEDTDQNRFVEGATENLIKVLNDIGIEFDEGYKIENNALIERGEFGPYQQSKRLDIYHKHVEDLIQKGSAYYCFCSETRLDEIRREQIALKKPPMYDRLCRKLSKEESEAKLKEFSEKHLRPVVRQAIPLEGQTVVHDLIYGDISFEHHTLDDQVILKSDSFPTYHLAVVVDDHSMEISHVIRGDEWIASTPKHLLLYKAFGWEPTKFAHLPLILNPDKSKLSKRQGDVAVESYLEKGYLREALVNFVAFLGWNPKTEQEIFSMEELIAQFDLAKVNKAGAVFDIEKLNWINSKYIRNLSDEKLAELLLPYWKKAGIVEDSVSMEYVTRVAGLEKERLKILSEITDRTSFYFKEPTYEGIEDAEFVWKKSTKEECKERLEKLVELLDTQSDFGKEALEAKIKAFIAENNYDTGSVLWPMRLSLTGLKASPGPFELASALASGLGKDVVLNRLRAGIAKLS